MEPPQLKPEQQAPAQAARWKDLASRCRQMAKHTVDPVARSSLLEMAVEYEVLVANAGGGEASK